MDTVAAAQTVLLATVITGRRRIGQGRGTAGTIGRANRVDRPALGASDFSRHLPLLEVGLDFAGRVIPVVDIFREINPDEFKKPAPIRRQGGVWCRQKALQLADGRAALWGLARRQMVKR